MAGAWTTLTILDGGSTSRTMRVWDESGAGTGPFSFAQMASSGAGSGGEPALETGNLATLAGTVSAGKVAVTTNGTVTAVGDAANGSAVAGNPVLVAGSDGTDARTLTTNASGELLISLAGTNSVGITNAGQVGSGSSIPVVLSTGQTFNGQNQATPTNEIVVGGQFNTSPTTITSGNVSPLQLDASGNLLVNIKAGAGSGGTALTDEATFTEGTTSFTPVGGTYKTSQTALTSGQAGAVALDANRNLMVNIAAGGGTGGTAIADESTFTEGTTNFTPVGGIYKSAQTPLTTGEAGAVGMTVNREMYAAGPALAPTVSASAEGTHLFKSTPGQVKGLYAVNLTSTPGFLLLIDATSIPADGAVTPVGVVPLPANDIAELSGAILSALQFTNGIVAVLSSASTPFTKTTGVITGFISCQFI